MVSVQRTGMLLRSDVYLGENITVSSLQNDAGWKKIQDGSETPLELVGGSLNTIETNTTGSNCLSYG